MIDAKIFPTPGFPSDIPWGATNGGKRGRRVVHEAVVGCNCGVFPVRPDRDVGLLASVAVSCLGSWCKREAPI